MKRFLAILLCGILSCSMMACGKQQTPQEIYEAAQAKNASLASMDMTANSTVIMKQQELEMTQTVQSEIKLDNLDTDKMRYLMTGATSIDGQSLEMSMFYTDGYYYMETAGQKIKAPMDLVGMTEQIQQSTGFSQFAAADFQELTAVKSKTGQVLTYKVDPAKVSDLMESVYQTMGIDESLGGDMKIHEMSGEFTINDKGYYSAMKSFMKIDMTVQGETISMEVTMDSVIHNPGQAVEVSLPSTEGFEEIDPALLGLN